MLKCPCVNGCLENSDLRPQTSKTQTSKTRTSKTQTSKTQTSKTQYTFDENSRMVLIFPTVFDYWRAKLLSSAVSCLSISIAELATRTGNSQMHTSFVDLGSMIA